MKCREVLQYSDGLSNKVSSVSRRNIDNLKLLIIRILLLSYSFIFFRFYFLSMYIRLYSSLIMQITYLYCYVSVFLLHVYVYPTCRLALFGYPDRGFPVFFLSCKANARVKHAQKRHDTHSPKLLYRSMYYYFCDVLCIVCVCKCVLYYCHRVANKLQLTNIS